VDAAARRQAKQVPKAPKLVAAKLSPNLGSAPPPAPSPRVPFRLGQSAEL
jgi:hypothetical protein